MIDWIRVMQVIDLVDPVADPDRYATLMAHYLMGLAVRPTDPTVGVGALSSSPAFDG